MPVSKRRKTGKSAGSRSSSRAPTPVPSSRPESPVAAPPESVVTNPDVESDDSTPPLVLTSEKRRGVYECDYCHTDISQLPRIRCAECPDFDLCLDCFLTTDHNAAVARMKASAEVRSAVENLSTGGGSHAQHQGKQVPSGSSAGDTEPVTGVLSIAWHTGSGAINHKDTHGYRVCDNTRYPMFPSARRVVPSRPNSVVNEGGTGVGSARGSVSGDDEKEKEKEKARDEDGMDVDEMEEKTETSDDNMNKDEAPESGSSQEVTLLPDDPRAVWTVEEDLRLLDAIQTHGLGNWLDISEAVSGHGSSGKTPKRCMERYFDDFLGHYGHILPPYTLVDGSPDDKEEERDENDDNEENDKGETNSDNVPGSATKDMDPTRLSKRRHSIMVRTSTSAAVQSMNRLSKKLKPVPTESLPEYQKVLQMFPDPKVPVKDPPVQRGQEVGRDQSAKAEQLFVKTIANIPKEEEQKIRKEWMETKYMQPGGPTVLPARPEDVALMPGAELAGFMPRRGDFDIEWDNDAEKALADMEFLPGDLPEDKELKLKVLKIYNEKLDEREKRKKFILSRNLHDYRKNQEEDAKLPTDERDLVRRMRLFERFHTPEEHKQFIEDILQAKRLRKEIAKLQMYRRLGITSVAEAEKFELDKNRRQFHKAARDKAAQDQAARTSSAGGQNTAAGDDSNAVDKASLWKRYSLSGKGRRRSTSRGIKDGTLEDATSDIKATEEESAKKDGEALVRSKDGGSGSTEIEGDAVSKLEPGKPEVEKEVEMEKKEKNCEPTADDDFPLREMEGFEMISDKEANLLRKIRLTPTQYMEVKRVLIHESLKSGLLDKEGSNNRRTLVKIDIEKRGDVIDFMVQAGWVKSKIGAQARTISE